MEELPAGYLRHGQERLPSMALGCRENRTESQLEAKDPGAWGGLNLTLAWGSRLQFVLGALPSIGFQSC